MVPWADRLPVTPPRGNAAAGVTIRNMPQVTIEQAMQLASRHYAGGNLRAAGEICRSILDVLPDHAPATHLLGLIAHQKGDQAAAVELLYRSIRLDPASSEYYSNCGGVLRMLGRFDEALACLQQAVALDPDNASALNNLAIELSSRGQHDQAIDAWRRAIALEPRDCRYHQGLGCALTEVGLLDEAIASLQHAIELDADFVPAYSSLLLAFNYHPRSTPAFLLEQHRRFARRFAEPLTAAAAACGNNPDPDRTLRIGYVSGDFRRHSVMYFLEPILRHHDRSAFDVFCYSTCAWADQVTDRLRQCASQFRDIAALDDEAAAALVRSDAIDILVDLSGHMSGGRLLVFARKPAPVQVSYLGYPSTTAMSAIDYRITDAAADPPGMTDAYFSERLLRLPQTFLCYGPPSDAPDVAPPPFEIDDRVTFGSFNMLAKLTPQTIAAWARILAAVSGSRLLLKCGPLGSAPTATRITAAFAGHGIAADRLILMGHIDSHSEHLAAYGRIDIALDSFPYNGATTTCEAMWMGVPVVALAGETHHARVGVSLLTAVGLPELIAHDIDDYVRLAVELAQDRGRLTRLRREMRPRMAQSALTDGGRFSGSLEAVYRRIWREWCARRTCSPA